MVATNRGTGADLGLLRSHFHRAGYPRIGATREDFERYIAPALEAWPGALLVFDSASKGLSFAGLDENSNTDATKWTTEIILPAREAGASVAVIGHVPKGATRATPYPRGAGSQLADTEVMIYVEKVEPVGRERVGKVRLTLHKDREDVLAPSFDEDGAYLAAGYRMGDGNGGLPVERIGLHEASGDSDMRHDILAALRDAGEDGLSGRQLRELVEGRNETVSAEARGMALDPTEPVRHEAQGKQAVRYYFAPAAADDGSGIAV